MSQSPLGTTAQPSYLEGWKALTEMILEGQSFSGSERNTAFLNTRKGRFSSVSSVTGFDFPDDGRALAAVDWDFDGDLDIWQMNRTAPRVRFLRNQFPRTNAFLALHLEGRTVNRDAIGTRLELYLKSENGEEERQLRTLRAGEGFLGQSSKWVHFGLGKFRTVDRLVVRWPGGEMETFNRLPANRFYRIVEGSGKAESWEPPKRTLRLADRVQKMPEPSARTSILLTSRIPIPDLPFATLDGEQKRLAEQLKKGKPLLVNLWASWCAPCLAELKSLAGKEEALRSAGLEILALSVDGVGEDAGRVENARTFLERINFPFPVGRATESFLETIEILRNAILDVRRNLLIPTSFLIDGNGRLGALYRGPVEIDRLIADLPALKLNGEARLAAALPFRGRWLAPPLNPRLLPVAWELLEEGDLKIAGPYIRRNSESLAGEAEFSELLYVLGNRYNEEKLFKQAESSYREAIEANPRFAKPYYGLGLKLQERGRLDDALDAYRQSLEINPSLSKPHFMLGMGLEEKWGREKLDQAIAQFQEAVRLDPNYLFARFYLGLAFEKKREPQNAFQAYAKALEINPRFQPAREGMERLRKKGIKKADPEAGKRRNRQEDR